MQTQPIELLTIRRISQLTNRPVSEIEKLLDEHPKIKPSAVADCRRVYDRTAFLQLLETLERSDTVVSGSVKESADV